MLVNDPLKPSTGLADRTTFHPKILSNLIKAHSTISMTQINTKLPAKYVIFSYSLCHCLFNLLKGWSLKYLFHCR